MKENYPASWTTYITCSHDDRTLNTLTPVFQTDDMEVFDNELNKRNLFKDNAGKVFYCVNGEFYGYYNFGSYKYDKIFIKSS